MRHQKYIKVRLEFHRYTRKNWLEFQEITHRSGSSHCSWLIRTSGGVELGKPTVTLGREISPGIQREVIKHFEVRLDLELQVTVGVNAEKVELLRRLIAFLRDLFGR